MLCNWDFKSWQVLSRKAFFLLKAAQKKIPHPFCVVVAEITEIDNINRVSYNLLFIVSGVKSELSLGYCQNRSTLWRIIFCIAISFKLDGLFASGSRDHARVWQKNCQFQHHCLFLYGILYFFIYLCGCNWFWYCLENINNALFSI